MFSITAINYDICQLVAAKKKTKAADSEKGIDRQIPIKA